MTSLSWEETSEENPDLESADIVLHQVVAHHLLNLPIERKDSIKSTTEEGRVRPLLHHLIAHTAVAVAVHIIKE